jgi:hypothetical protein
VTLIHKIDPLYFADFEILQDAAEIVKHFKILVTCFSARVSRSAGIFEHKQWPSDLVKMERWGVRERVCECCGTVYSDGVN